MVPIVGRYGPFLIYSFTLVMWLGVTAAIAVTAWRARRLGQPGWPDALLFSTAVGLSGGRAVFVAAQWPYFAAQPLEIAWLWRGGLSYHGLLLAGLLALWGWSRRYKRAFGQDADLIAPALALLPAFGWTACWLGGCAYGRVAAPGLLAGYAPDLFGVYALRYQTQLLGLAWNLPLFALLWRLNGRWPAGRLFWLALFLVSSGHFLITWLRGDAAPWLGPWRLDTWLDGSLALISLVKWRRCKPVTAVTKV